jgi:hypothetical protein
MQFVCPYCGPIDWNNKYSYSYLILIQSQIQNSTKFPIMTTLGYLVGLQCNSIAYFISEKCNVPDGIRFRGLWHCKPPLFQRMQVIIINKVLFKVDIYHNIHKSSRPL